LFSNGLQYWLERKTAKKENLDLLMPGHFTGVHAPTSSALSTRWRHWGT